MTVERQVVLRDEHDGEDSRSLIAYHDGGDLRIDGQDLGPSTKIMSPDGEYEWTTTIAAADLPKLVEHLGGQAGEHILDLLERSWTGPRSYDLEPLLRDGYVPHEFWSYP